MNDREFDQLFKDRFEELEVQPSARLWNNIAAELKPVKKRNVFPVYWVAAVLALVLLSVVLIAPDQEKIKLHGTAVAVDEIPALTGNQMVSPVRVKTIEKNEIEVYKSTALVIAPRLDEAAAEREFRAMQPKSVAARPMAKENIIAEVKTAEEPVIVDNNIVIAKADVPDERNNDETIETDPAAYKGIRNVGDLVNYVVDKVDKRERKFLKFSTDEDNSSLIGINIGFIKLNSKRHK